MVTLLISGILFPFLLWLYFASVFWFGKSLSSKVEIMALKAALIICVFVALIVDIVVFLISLIQAFILV